MRKGEDKRRAGLLIALLFLFFSISGCISHFVYYPDREILCTPAVKNLSYEWVSMVSRDGVAISGWWVPAGAPKGVVLICHGNGGNISYLLETLVIFNRMGLSALVFDYRGYGRSGGRPSEQGTYLDAEAAWDYLANVRKTEPGKIIIFGRSLGGAIAARTARDHQPAILILESSFTSIADVAVARLPWFPVRYLDKYRYDTLGYLKSVECPTVVIHSRDDETIPFPHGEKLYAVAKHPGGFLEIEGSHNTGFLYSRDKYETFLRDCIARHLGLQD